MKNDDSANADTDADADCAEDCADCLNLRSDIEKELDMLRGDKSECTVYDSARSFTGQVIDRTEETIEMLTSEGFALVLISAITAITHPFPYAKGK